jgi:diguanylate cyclase (GGDEF)-like protein
MLVLHGAIALSHIAHPLLVTATAGLLGAFLAAHLGHVLSTLLAELECLRGEMALLATRDDLTGLHNRRHFLDLAQREWDRARRYGTPAAMLMIDADHFRHVNEKHGQHCGDVVLKGIADAVHAQLRQADVLARFGGEELAVFLPHTDPLGALDVAERIRERVQALTIPWQSERVGTTVSVGVAPLRAELPSLDWMIHEADTALCSAKAAGRNCVRALPYESSRSGGAFSVHPR